MQPAKREDFRHFIPLTVQWGDMDILGHVNNVIYFRYIESGRIAYFDTVLGNDPAIWGGEGPILADIQCQFIQQVRYPASIEVATRVARLGGKSLTLETAIFHQGMAEPVAVSRAAIVWFNYSQQASVRVSEPARAAIRAYELLAPAE